MNFYPDPDWFILMDPKVTKALKRIEGANWPTSFESNRYFKEPIEWYDMPAVQVLNTRISFFGEGDWNEPEMAEEWSAWDERLPVEMANLTLAIAERYKEVRNWEERPSSAPRVYQVMNVPMCTIEESFIGDAEIPNKTWDEIVAELKARFGVITTAETLRKEAAKFGGKVRGWIDQRLRIKETPQFECWHRDSIEMEGSRKRYLERLKNGSA